MDHQSGRTGGLAPNDWRLYERLADQWWRPRGAFVMLHWLAAARADLIPPAPRPGAVLLDLGCGAGLLAPHIRGKGYRHVGVDLSPSALAQARAHGVEPVRGNVLAVPMGDESVDVVVAGEILEHVPDLPTAIAHACRVLRPGGLLVLDTLAATALCRFLAITVAERLPGTVPRGIHDPALLVDRSRLVRECARHGVRLAIRGIRPSMTGLAAWLSGRAARVPMVPTRTTAVLFQGRGSKSTSGKDEP